MSVAEIVSKTTTANVVGLILILLSLIEVTPIKISPLAWLGKRINAPMLDRIDKLESKLDEHVAEAYRNQILAVQERLIKGERLTQEEWKKTLKPCEAYHSYIEENKLSNELVDSAIYFIKRKYQHALDCNDFVDLQNIK